MYIQMSSGGASACYVIELADGGQLMKLKLKWIREKLAQNAVRHTFSVRFMST